MQPSYASQNVWFEMLHHTFIRKMAKQCTWTKLYSNICGSPFKDIRSFRFFPQECALVENSFGIKQHREHRTLAFIIKRQFKIEGKEYIPVSFKLHRVEK